MSNIRLANSIFVNQLGKQGRSGERAASNTQVGSSNCWFTSFPVVLNLSYYYTGAVTARQDLCSFICVIETVSMRVGHGAPQSGAALVRRTSVFASGENLGAGAALLTPSIINHLRRPKRRTRLSVSFFLEHRNTIDATAFTHSQASSILFFYSMGDGSPL